MDPEYNETTRGRKFSSKLGIQPRDRIVIKFVSYCVILQCVLVFIGAATVLQCMWSPDYGIFEMDTLARMMYLYDTNSCGAMITLKHYADLSLKNETYGLPIRPIRHAPVSFEVLTKLSGKFRTHMQISICIHVIWTSAAVILRLFISVKDLKVLKIILKIFFYVSCIILFFDLCMSIVYVTHVQQCLTKGMIIRYSGWGMKASKVSDASEFGGWIPLIASAAWLRGGMVFVNMLMCRFIKGIIHKIVDKEVTSRLRYSYNVPFPDANYNQKIADGSLYYRAGADNKF